jgi:hypothetical protein
VYMHVYKHLHGIIFRQTGISCKNTAPQCHSNILFIMFHLGFIFYFYLWPSFYLPHRNSHLSPIPHPNPQPIPLISDGHPLRISTQHISFNCAVMFNIQFQSI